MNEVHQIATTRMIGEPEDELVTVVCACGWESPRTWYCDDSISTAFAEHLQTLAPVLEHGGPAISASDGCRSSFGHHDGSPSCHEAARRLQQPRHHRDHGEPMGAPPGP